MTSAVVAGTSPAEPERFEALDALRGLAALSVLLGHLLMFLVTRFESTAVVRLIAHTPLAVVISSIQAVRFFFVLSGFVLTVSYLRGPPRPVAFIVRRVLRIYPAYLVAILIAFIAAAVLYPTPPPALSGLFRVYWRTPASPHDMLQHLLMAVPWPRNVYDPPIWSLGIEMRMSIVLPLLVTVVRRWSPARLLALVLVFAGAEHTWHWARGVPDEGLDYPTVYYLSMFVLGIGLALYRQPLLARLRALSARGRVVLLGVAWLTYSYPYWMLQGVPRWHVWWLDDGLVVIGSALALIVTLGSQRLTDLLRRQPFLWLGRVSYSLYLWHVIVILGLGYTLSHRVADVPLTLLAVVLSAAVAEASYRWIERPYMRMGRLLTERLAARP